MINSFKIKIVKIVIIKINTTQGYNIKTFIIAKECNKARLQITKDYILLVINKSGTNFNANRKSSVALSDIS